MSPAEIREVVHATLRRIAPDVDPAQLRPNESLREQADIDSVDFLAFMVGLHAELGVDVPEADYAQLQTLDECVRYLERRLSGVAG